MTDLKSCGYGMEVSLSRFAQARKFAGFLYSAAPYFQIMKEEKGGCPGFAARMKMYWEIILFLLGVKLPPQ